MAMIYLCVFLVTFVSDLLCAVYIKKVASNETIYASLCSATLFISSWIAGYYIVQDLPLVLVGGLGAFLGTFVVLRFFK